MPERPRRKRIQTELGKMQTPAYGEREFVRMAGTGDVLLLGIGPDPALIADLLPAGKAIYVIEAPFFKSQMDDDWHRSIPPSWQEIAPNELSDAFIRTADIIMYRPALRHFPTFWGALSARCRYIKAQAAGSQEPRRYAIIPGTEDNLLIPELSAAFEKSGLRVRRVHPRQAGSLIPHLLRAERPAMFFSVNFEGLDAYGELYHLLRAAGIAVGVWCVDNPFHLLSGVRSPYWKDMDIFVTDAGFIPMLEAHGATKVHHLPLAAWPEHFIQKAVSKKDHGVRGRMTFVGRSAFPNKDKFFAGCTISDKSYAAALEMIEEGKRPDFSWWVDKCSVSPLWPGPEVRNAGYGAESASRDRRIHCLIEAAHMPLVIYGDKEWKSHLPRGAEVRPPIDYYTELPAIYRQAGWTLNVTSLLLPEGLTQRHFDVWTAGGFLLTDNTPGLGIFPPELTEPITFDLAEDIPRLAARLRPGTKAREDIQRAWQEHILAHHTYVHRVQKIMGVLEVE